MTDLVLTWVADYGLYIVFAVIFLSCTALPTPSSPLMLVAGGFAAAGDLVFVQVYLTALVAAILGDNATYGVARYGGEKLEGWLHERPKRSALYNRAARFMDKWGGISVFLSCWLIGPLGPYMNYVSGITKFSWPRFAIWGVWGEAIWVGIYTGLGFVFADKITSIGSLMGNISGFMVAGVAVVALGLWAWKVSHPGKSDI